MSKTTLNHFNSIGIDSYLESLLRVSMASASSLGPEQQAIAALDELIITLGAERAYLFIAEKDENQQPIFKLRAGRNNARENLPELFGYSSTVVNKAFNEKKAIIVSGTNEGELLGSKSAVIHDLRSILAAPLCVNDEVLGVVYIDNRMIKGLFTESHIEFLSAVTSHIAVNLKLVSMAQKEIEKKGMEKDLAMVAALQSMFLPSPNGYKNKNISLCGTSLAATQAGGDWWWYRATEDQKITIFIGDVTGHGPGPAMLTASASSQVRAIQSILPETGIDKILCLINDEFASISKGKFLMTLSVLEIDNELNCKFTNAAAPGFFILRKDLQLEEFFLKSAIIGLDPTYEVSSQDFKMEPGDRLFLVTDGLLELKLANETEINNRAVKKILKQTAGMSTQEALNFLFKTVDTLRGSTPLADDITIIIIDII